MDDTAEPVHGDAKIEFGPANVHLPFKVAVDGMAWLLYSVDRIAVAVEAMSKRQFEIDSGLAEIVTALESIARGGPEVEDEDEFDEHDEYWE